MIKLFLPRIPGRTGYKNLLGYDDDAVADGDPLLDFKHLVNVTVRTFEVVLCLFLGDLFYRSIDFAFRKVSHNFAFYPVKPIGQLFVLSFGKGVFLASFHIVNYCTFQIIG